ncbi:regulatory protein RecX [Erythrobacter sp. 3-20A1M]|uniref:regulatory protein RecX n=1 Tax=Erythrobacter sp. 3-20A1M TaxID=2653850 RepID=UPI0035304921
MAALWPMNEANRDRRRPARPKRPLDRPGLRDLALSYVARYATSTARLERYLRRKLRERGWEEEGEPDIGALVAEFAELGYVDDAAFAKARAGDLLRRGYGARRVDQALGEAGIGERIRQDLEPDERERRHAALLLARKRRFGPFAAEPLDRPRREKQLAAMVRAGHGFSEARAVIDANDEREAESWAGELDE